MPDFRSASMLSREKESPAASIAERSARNRGFVDTGTLWSIKTGIPEARNTVSSSPA